MLKPKNGTLPATGKSQVRTQIPHETSNGNSHGSARLFSRAVPRDSSHDTSDNVTRALFWMVLAELALRLIVMLFLYGQTLDPSHDHWNFAFEEGRVARAFAEGRGFANPLYAPTGPSAWFPPVYVFLLGETFKLFGVFTRASALIITSFNCLASALTCLPIFFFARKTFGAGAAKLAGWVWALFPLAIYGPVMRIWETWLATLILSIAFFVLLKLENSPRISHWIGFGLLGGLAALTCPVLLLGICPLALWTLWRLRQHFPRRKKCWLAPGCAAVLAAAIVIAPWIVRNYEHFHKFIPISDSLGLEIGIGNNGRDTWFMYSIPDGPWNPWKGPAEQKQWSEFQRLGEVNYFALKGREGMAYIRAHPAWYAEQVVRRIGYIWTDFWSFSKRYRTEAPGAVVIVCLYTLLSVLALMGVARAWRSKGANAAMPYIIVLFFFPLIFYLTHPADWYRRPIDPLFVALAAYEVAARVRQRVRPAQKSGRDDGPDKRESRAETRLPPPPPEIPAYPAAD